MIWPLDDKRRIGDPIPWTHVPITPLPEVTEDNSDEAWRLMWGDTVMMGDDE